MKPTVWRSWLTMMRIGGEQGAEPVGAFRPMKHGAPGEVTAAVN